MRLSLGLTTFMPLEKSLPLARLAEKTYYSRIWLGENLNGRDVFAYLSVLATKTEKIQIGTGITSPFVRNWAVIANSCAGIQSLSQGRFILGLGVGGIPEITAAIGRKPKGIVSEMEKTVLFLKKVLKGEEATIHSRYARIRRFSLAVSVTPPKIYLGVRGPKMLALAGRVADGVIFSGPPKYLKEAVSIVEAAAQDAGRNPSEIDKVVWNPFVLVEKDEDITLAAAMVDVMLPSMPPMAKKHLAGLGKNELIGNTCICGDPEEIKGQLTSYSRMGFSEIVVGPPYGREPERTIETLGEVYGLRDQH